jgi:hypothetical protein
MPRDFKARIAIGDKKGTRSAVWVVATAKNDVYAAHRTSQGIEKISFHQSRICRRAFTAEHGTPAGMTGRTISRWVRSETMPAGAQGMVRLLSVSFPGLHVTPDALPLAPARHSTHFFTDRMRIAACAAPAIRLQRPGSLILHCSVAVLGPYSRSRWMNDRDWVGSRRFRWHSRPELRIP